jgi:hypothetical protein
MWTSVTVGRQALQDPEVVRDRGTFAADAAVPHRSVSAAREVGFLRRDAAYIGQSGTGRRFPAPPCRIYRSVRM